MLYHGKALQIIIIIIIFGREKRTSSLFRQGRSGLAQRAALWGKLSSCQANQWLPNTSTYQSHPFDRRHGGAGGRLQHHPCVQRVARAQSIEHHLRRLRWALWLHRNLIFFISVRRDPHRRARSPSSIPGAGGYSTLVTWSSMQSQLRQRQT